MVLTPDQKKRIAALEAKPAETEEEPEDRAQVLSGRIRSVGFSVRTSATRTTVAKVLILCAFVGVAAYFVTSYQLHRIDLRAVFSSGPGSPVDRLWYAVKLQKQKADMLRKGHAQFLAGEYKEALLTATAVSQLDSKDPRAPTLIKLATDAATQRATREFDSGEIETALIDTRLALRFKPDHKAAKELQLNIAARLQHEAEIHHNKKEYFQLINKAQEVLKIDPSNMSALNLLMRTNSELLTLADELFIARDYLQALDKVRLSRRIDPGNARALRLLNRISVYIEAPQPKLRGIIKKGKTIHAQIQLPGSNRLIVVRKGDTVKNFKIVGIDPNAETVELVQIYTKQKLVIRKKSGFE